MNDNGPGSLIKGISVFVIGLIMIYAGMYLDAQLHAEYRSLLPYLVPDSVIVITAGFFVIIVGLFVTFYGMVIMARN
ncbi:MAG: hypothetical protein ACXABV_12675 [Candidatus Thorarchaeota archaeon]